MLCSRALLICLKILLCTKFPGNKQCFAYIYVYTPYSAKCPDHAMLPRLTILADRHVLRLQISQNITGCVVQELSAV